MRTSTSDASSTRGESKQSKKSPLDQMSLQPPPPHPPVLVSPPWRIIVIASRHPHPPSVAVSSPFLCPIDANAEPPVKPEAASTAEAAKPLAPPPRPGQQQGTDTADYFAATSFGGAPETLGGTKLPSVAALTSPSSLFPGPKATPFNWGGVLLQTGPLSPAMLSGPANDYFGDTYHLRGGFPTPNESSLRAGLTPGSGSMFPAPSPNSQALFAHLASGGTTPSTIDFHRTAMSVAARREQTNGVQRQSGQSQQAPPQQQQSVTSQPQGIPNGPVVVNSETKPVSGPFDPHANDASNGLFMLAQGRNEAQSTNQFAVTSGATSHAHPSPVVPRNMNTSSQMSRANGGSIGSVRGVSEGSVALDDSDQARPNPRGKGKKNPPTTNSRRKADKAPAKAPPNKKSKANSGAVAMAEDMDISDDESNMNYDENGSKTMTTDEEKRKNFLERNRWLANLQTNVKMFNTENDTLTSQITQLRAEVVNLKTLLLAHKDCPVTQQRDLHSAFMSQAVEPFNPQMNPYGMGAPMPNQPFMAGQGVQRHFS
ncbi:Aft1 HRA domain-containing protein [Ilyonectria robusta]|uniref:Aft1 HRA domain-containing protein n=1 Tax=Ilyonectria robusta TaxID=1079257 RepID=UPI001E8DF129|nr:Aft1 HRA domain-containing protein [Ilyonectria robusta]KAH8657231.1 Aft1 HRA domain-containing protein [Ilyonectria robusta]